MKNKLTVVQMLPALNSGGVERGTVDLSNELVKRGWRSIVVSSDGRMREELIDGGAEHLNWEVGKKSLSTFKYIVKIRRLLINENVDVLHLRSRLPAWMGYLAWLTISKDKRPYLVTTVHGPYSVGWYSSVMTRGESVIAVSDYIKNYILDNYLKVNEQAIKVIHRGINTHNYYPSFRAKEEWRDSFFREYPELKGKRIILFPGRVTRWKGQLEFIDLFKELLNDHLDLHGLVVGGADPRREAFFEEVKEKVRVNKLDDAVTFTGDRRDMREIMSISSMVVSLANAPEAFGRTVMESLSLGVPVVGYSHGGVEEQLQSMCPEGMVKPLDIKDALRAAKQILESHHKVKPNKDYTLSMMLDKTIKIYQDGLALRSR